MKTSIKTVIASFAYVLLAQGTAMASAAHGTHQHGAASVTAASADMADGEVRKVDAEGGKITLKHGEIKNLDMPPMTMVFVVKDKAMLDNVKRGDKVKFKVINDAGRYTVTEIQPAKP